MFILKSFMLTLAQGSFSVEWMFLAEIQLSISKTKKKRFYLGH